MATKKKNDGEHSPRGGAGERWLCSRQPRPGSGGVPQPVTRSSNIQESLDAVETL